MSTRYYANAPSHTIPGGVANGTTVSIVVDSVTGWPTQFPFTAIVEPDSVLEEVVDVTNIVGLTLTVTRGADGTTASAHAAGVKIMHGMSARDATEANTHINATTGIHGSNGSLVDTGSAQTIAGNKTLSGTTTANGALNTNGANTHAGNNTFQSGVNLTVNATLQSQDTNVDSQIKGDGTGRLREVALGRHAAKTGDTSSSSTTLINATDLVFPMVANGIYEVDICLSFTSTSSTANTQIGWALPVGANHTSVGTGPGSGDASSVNGTANHRTIIGAFAATIVFGSPAAGSGYSIVMRSRIVNGANAGNAQLVFAEAVASASITMKSPSWITARRVA